ncbi:hypothetical protein LRP50_24400 [Enterovibrio sp. ZSDZ42]|uniref:Uncharacterized protein n=1 Tax=Enterovibrio gelatinilyticus TaxID=2899819 RepID=A0ABT5R7P0_9GAMM|nr:hypothetical protein [Enterovibrio sp. ZSDZ42]MDD1796266.1 hypothetical protein [Enterovibrio sp. ZSDZ42]
MGKSELTRIKLEEALERILSGHPIIIPKEQKLSVKAVEEEAGLGSGSVYYYKDIVEKIKNCNLKLSSKSEPSNAYEDKIKKLREKLSKEVRLKDKYRSEIEELKHQLSSMASQHNQLALTIQQYQYKVGELEAEASKAIQKISKPLSN